MLPGLPTSAELFILPYQDATGQNKRRAADLEQVLCPLLGEVFVYAFVCIHRYLWDFQERLEQLIMVQMHLVHWELNNDCDTCYIIFGL